MHRSPLQHSTHQTTKLPKSPAGDECRASENGKHQQAEPMNEAGGGVAHGLGPGRLALQRSDRSEHPVGGVQLRFVLLGKEPLKRFLAHLRLGGYGVKVEAHELGGEVV